MSNFFSNLKQRWAIVGAAVTALGALFSILDILPKLTSTYEHAWTLSFVPDVLVIVGLALLMAVVCVQWGREWGKSYVQTIKTGPWWQKVVLVVFSMGLLAAMISSIGDWKAFYRVRVFSAKFNWTYYDAKSQLARGDFAAALASFKRMRETDAYVSKQLNDRRRKEELDTQQRLADVELYMSRYKQVVSQKRGTVADLLLVQRAAQLYPDSPEVLRMTVDAQQRARVGLELYFTAIGALQQGQFQTAQSTLADSVEKSGIRFYDQPLLARYCADQDMRHFSRSEVELLSGYLHIPVGSLKFALEDQHAWVAELLAMGSTPVGMYDAKIRNYYQQLIEREKIDAVARDEGTSGPL